MLSFKFFGTVAAGMRLVGIHQSQALSGIGAERILAQGDTHFANVVHGIPALFNDKGRWVIWYFIAIAMIRLTSRIGRALF